MTIPVTTAFSSITRINTMLTLNDTFYFLCGMEKENGKAKKEFLAHTCTLNPTKIPITKDAISHFKCLSSWFHIVKIKFQMIQDINERTTDQIQNTFSSQNHSHKPSGLF